MKCQNYWFKKGVLRNIANFYYLHKIDTKLICLLIWASSNIRKCVNFNVYCIILAESDRVVLKRWEARVDIWQSSYWSILKNTSMWLVDTADSYHSWQVELKSLPPVYLLLFSIQTQPNFVRNETMKIYYQSADRIAIKYVYTCRTIFNYFILKTLHLLRSIHLKF